MPARTYPYPLGFDELWDQSTKVELPDTSACIASIDRLTLMKRKASRRRDLPDIEPAAKIE
jgi:hypothetical protein